MPTSGEDSFTYTVSSGGVGGALLRSSINDAPLAGGNSQLDAISEDASTSTARACEYVCSNFSDQADATGANDTFDSGSDGWSNGSTEAQAVGGRFWALHH